MSIQPFVHPAPGTDARLPFLVDKLDHPLPLPPLATTQLTGERVYASQNGFLAQPLPYARCARGRAPTGQVLGVASPSQPAHPRLLLVRVMRACACV